MYNKKTRKRCQQINAKRTGDQASHEAPKQIRGENRQQKGQRIPVPVEEPRQRTKGWTSRSRKKKKTRKRRLQRKRSNARSKEGKGGREQRVLAAKGPEASPSRAGDFLQGKDRDQQLHEGHVQEDCH
ncbi:hypothetical protein SLE2022_001780 [Rubroshorea leprosula]